MWRLTLISYWDFNYIVSFVFLLGMFLVRSEIVKFLIYVFFFVILLIKLNENILFYMNKLIILREILILRLENCYF